MAQAGGDRLGDSVRQFQNNDVHVVSTRLCIPGSRARPVKRAGVLKLCEAIHKDGYDEVIILMFLIYVLTICICVERLYYRGHWSRWELLGH
jgi:hypothetical protein